MPRIGYARVSSSSQDLEIQKARLKAAGCEIVRAETGSGASRDGRNELATILEFLRADDELVVLRLDRLGRSTRDVLNLVHELDAKGASLRVLEPEVTTAGGMGRMVITVLGMVADMELTFIRDRQRAGIEAAKQKGVYKGRRKQVDDLKIRRLAAEGASKAKIARDMGVSRMTVYRALESEAEGVNMIYSDGTDIIKYANDAKIRPTRTASLAPTLEEPQQNSISTKKNRNT